MYKIFQSSSEFLKVLIWFQILHNVMQNLKFVSIIKTLGISIKLDVVKNLDCIFYKKVLE